MPNRDFINRTIEVPEADFSAMSIEKIMIDEPGSAIVPGVITAKIKPPPCAFPKWKRQTFLMVEFIKPFRLQYPKQVLCRSARGPQAGMLHWHVQKVSWTLALAASSFDVESLRR